MYDFGTVWFNMYGSVVGFVWFSLYGFVWFGLYSFEWFGMVNNAIFIIIDYNSWLELFQGNFQGILSTI